MLRFLLFPLLLFTLLFPPKVIAGTPDCYKQAAMPAHKFFSLPVAERAGTSLITGITQDGEGCYEAVVLDGELVEEGVLYIPFGSLFMTYIQAMRNRDVAQIKELYQKTKALPKGPASYAKLLNLPPPTGVTWVEVRKLMRILEVDKMQWYDSIHSSGKPESELVLGKPKKNMSKIQAMYHKELDVDDTMSLNAIYLGLGGEVLPLCEPIYYSDPTMHVFHSHAIWTLLGYKTWSDSFETDDGEKKRIEMLYFCFES